MFENLLAQFVPYATCLRYAQSDAGVLRWLVNLAGGFASSKLRTAFRITRYFCRAGMSAESNALRRVFEGVVANCRNRMSLLASPRSRNSLAILDLAESRLLDGLRVQPPPRAGVRCVWLRPANQAGRDALSGDYEAARRSGKRVRFIEDAVPFDPIEGRFQRPVRTTLPSEDKSLVNVVIAGAR